MKHSGHILACAWVLWASGMIVGPFQGPQTLQMGTVYLNAFEKKDDCEAQMVFTAEAAQNLLQGDRPLYHCLPVGIDPEPVFGQSGALKERTIAMQARKWGSKK